MRKLTLLFLGTLMAAIVWVTPAVIAGPTSSSNVENRASGGGHYLVAGSLDVQFAENVCWFRGGNPELCGLLRVAPLGPR